jgi:hypothetical protein
MEFAIVTFPSTRSVNVDGAQMGQTGRILRLQAGTHRFDLGMPFDYSPVSQTVALAGTGFANPLLVPFVTAVAARRRSAPAALPRKRTPKKAKARLTAKKRKPEPRKATVSRRKSTKPARPSRPTKRTHGRKKTQSKKSRG